MLRLRGVNLGRILPLPGGTVGEGMAMMGGSFLGRSKKKIVIIIKLVIILRIRLFRV